MPNRIRFIQKLRDKLNPILENAGFRIADFRTDGLETITYERIRPDLPGKDKINFHGTEDGQNHIYSTIVSGQGGLAFLSSLQELLPNYALLHFPDTKRWKYESKEELEVILYAISILVEQRLIPWFEQPEAKPIGGIAEDELARWKEQIARAASTYESVAKQRYKENNVAEAERFERMARLYREYLAKSP